MFIKIGIFSDKDTKKCYIVKFKPFLSEEEANEKGFHFLIEAMCNKAHTLGYFTNPLEMPLSQEQVIAQAKLLPTYFDFRLAAPSELPGSNAEGYNADPSFRNAWRNNNNKLEVDMIEARKIHLNRLRYLRDQQLSQLDVDYLKALEQDNTDEKTRINTLKKQLRDMTVTVSLDNIKEADQLKSHKPSYLEGDIDALQRMIF